MDARVECQADPASVRAARLFVVDRLQEWGADDVVDSAALLTSELATNAVLHTRRPFVVEVHRSSSVIRVEVVDRSEEIPYLPRHLARSAANGAPAAEGWDAEVEAEDRLFSGLGMVDAVATRWGAEPRPGEGKVVWFELALAADADQAGLSSLRGQPDDVDPLVAVLPPLEPKGLDDVGRVALLRALVIVAVLALLGIAIYTGLWAGGVLGDVWYGR